MDYKIVKRETIYLLGKKKTFKNEIIQEENNMDISKFWDEMHQKNLTKKILPYAVSEYVYGTCSPQNKESGYFDYGIMVEIDPHIDYPKDLDLMEVTPKTWAVFKCIGKDGQCIASMWQKIFSEFIVQTGYSIDDEVDFELYPVNETNDGLFCELWVPVKKIKIANSNTK